MREFDAVSNSSYGASRPEVNVGGFSSYRDDTFHPVRQEAGPREWTVALMQLGATGVKPQEARHVEIHSWPKVHAFSSLSDDDLVGDLCWREHPMAISYIHARIYAIAMARLIN